MGWVTSSLENLGNFMFRLLQIWIILDLLSFEVKSILVRVVSGDFSKVKSSWVEISLGGFLGLGKFCQLWRAPFIC